MKISVHHYQLSSRKGALLKIRFEDGSVGFADCHPWPELGDLPLAAQLQKLAHHTTTSLTAKSIKFAKRDAAARKQGIHLLRDLQVPKSHYLIMNLSPLTHQEIEKALVEGFTVFKVKLGSRLNEELPILNSLAANFSLKWRLDFNNRLPSFELLSIDGNGIEFLEDPFPYDKRWRASPYPIACDRQNDIPEESYDFKVFKPSVEDFKDTNKPLVVTSYLGHPLGQAADAYSAALLATKYDVRVSGLLSHRVYPRNSFSDQLSWEGPHWKSPEGTGLGFDNLLKTLSWVDI